MVFSLVAVVSARILPLAASRDEAAGGGSRILSRSAARMSMQHHPWARASRQSPGRRSCAARAELPLVHLSMRG